MTVLGETMKLGEQILTQGKMDVLARSVPPSSAVCLKWLPWVMLSDQDGLLMGMDDQFSYRKG